MYVVSVQKARPRNLAVGERTVETGIHKTPAETIHLRASGVEDDAVVNTRHHGGPDQAVYVYTAGDYTWWEEQLDRTLTPGTFGENITTSTSPNPVRAGDRLRIGPVLLEATAPRIPCATFAARMGEEDWIRRFRDAGRTGFYCRVLEPGTVQAGDPIEWMAAEPTNVTIDEMVQHAYAGTLEERDIRRALAAPIAQRARAAYEERLADLAGGRTS